MLFISINLKKNKKMNIFISFFGTHRMHQQYNEIQFKVKFRVELHDLNKIFLKNKIDL